MRIRWASLVGAFTLLASLYVFYLGNDIHSFSPKDNLKGFIAAIWTHVSYGLLLLIPFIIYGIVRGRNKEPSETDTLTRWAFRLFALTFVLKMITGILTVWTRGSPLKVFNWIAVPSPWERMDRPYGMLEAFHAWLAYPFLFSLVVFSLFAIRNTIRR